MSSNLPRRPGNGTANFQRVTPGAAISVVSGSGATAATPVVLAQQADRDPFRKVAFRAGLGLIFVQVAVLSELLTSVLHAHTYVLYLVAPPAILGAAITGGLLRTLRDLPGKMWLGLVCCMLLSVPGSSWRGDSAHGFKDYLEYALPFLFTVGGLTMTFSETRSIFTTIGAAGVVVVSAASLFAKEQSGRVVMASASGTIGNSNDLASHLIFVIPFLLYIAMDKRRAFLIRLLMIAPVAYALRTIFGTASRGAVIALIGAFLFALFWAPPKQRVAAVAIALILVVSIPFFLHGNAATRLESLLGGEHEEAQQSEESRSYLLKQSLIYTVKHPILGIGLGQFANYEGQQSIAAGKVGNWHETHNAFTEVSSECGVPALIFFVMGIGSAMFFVNRTYRKARREGYPEIANACFCYLLSMVGFMISITFLANGFRFYLPLMVGLAIALNATAKREMSAGGAPRGSPPAGLLIPVSNRARLARL
jgi:O-antigen ligase